MEFKIESISLVVYYSIFSSCALTMRSHPIPNGFSLD